MLRNFCECLAPQPTLDDPDLIEIASTLFLTHYDIIRLKEKFDVVCWEKGFYTPYATVDDFLHFLRSEKTPFSERCFAVIDLDGNGVIEFREFVIAIWNLASYDEHGLIRFVFQLFDSDDTGSISEEEMAQLIKSVHGKNYNKRLLAHVKKVLRRADKNKDHRYQIEELYEVRKKLPTIFLPAFEFHVKLQEEFFGRAFWEHVGKLRKAGRVAPDLRGLLGMNSQLLAKFRGKKRSDNKNRSTGKAWDGTRCALGSVVHREFGGAATSGKKKTRGIKVGADAKVVWNGRHFQAESHEGERASNAHGGGPAAMKVAHQHHQRFEAYKLDPSKRGGAKKMMAPTAEQGPGFGAADAALPAFNGPQSAAEDYAFRIGQLKQDRHMAKPHNAFL